MQGLSMETVARGENCHVFLSNFNKLYTAVLSVWARQSLEISCNI